MIDLDRLNAILPKEGIQTEIETRTEADRIRAARTHDLRPQSRVVQVRTHDDPPKPKEPEPPDEPPTR